MSTIEVGTIAPRCLVDGGARCPYRNYFSVISHMVFAPRISRISSRQSATGSLKSANRGAGSARKNPGGLGALTISLIEGAVCDWRRFSHRKAVGSYTGCCPSEHSSGGVQRFGAIDRHGNKHLRVTVGRGRVAAPSLAARLARAPEVFTKAQTWGVVEKDVRRVLAKFAST